MATTPSTDNPIHDEMLARVGQITRGLHENLRTIGYDRALEKLANEIPDVQDRLNYVAQMTEQAAQRVLNATDLASPLQDKIIGDSGALFKEWETVLSGRSQYSAYRDLGEKTQAYLLTTKNHAQVTKEQLLDIMMAQDFQDLTGQVVKRITQLIRDMEQQLVQFLLDYSPELFEANKNNINNNNNTTTNSGIVKNSSEQDSGLLNGPQINPEGKTDIVTDQEQVDNLLDSLGF